MNGMKTTSPSWNTLCPDAHVPPESLEAGAAFFPVDDKVRFVESGSVNLFIGSFDKASGLPVGTYLWVAGVDAGQCLFPMPVKLDKENTECRLVAIPLPGSVLRQSRVPWTELAREDKALCDLFEQFFILLLSPFAREMPPSNTCVITPADFEKSRSFQYPVRASVRPSHGLLWIHLRDGYGVLNGDEEQMLLAPGSEFPFFPQMWLQAMDPLSIECRTTAEVVADPGFAARHEQVLRHYLRAVLVAVSYRNQRHQRRQRLLIQHEQTQMKGVRARFRALIQGDRETYRHAPSAASPLHAVIQRVAQACGTKVELPEAPPEPGTDSEAALLRLLEQHNIFYRKIQLSGLWWKEEGSPAIAFRGPNKEPVALVPLQGTVRLWDPANGTETPLDAATAAQLAPTAISVYARLPARPLFLRDVLSLAFFQLRTDIRSTFLIGLLGGLVALLPARITSTLFNTLIPTADFVQLFQMGVILVSAACTGALFELTRSMLMLRIKTRSNYQLQAAIWGRLLNLPVGFFGSYSAGDLAQRVMGVDAIRSMLTDNVSQAGMALIFALPNLFLMLYYSPVLAGTSLMALLAYMAILMGIGLRNYRNQGREYQCDGELAGFALQALTGIAKIRMSISENRAFARWAAVFEEKVRWKTRSLNNLNVLELLGALFPPLMTGLFFWIVGSHWKNTTLNTGNYLAFNAAFSSLASAFTQFACIIPSLLASIALYQRLKPVLEATPEIFDSQKPAGEIDGNVEIRNVTYRYRPDLPPVLHDVTLRAKPGEFVAIVGPSGAGKSTLARLLLGFDTPESGGIYYGGIDMASVNRRDLRKQIGAVLQGGGLLQASIYDNIAGASGMSHEDVWEAAKLAGCDADIRAMPMGMHTLVFNGTVSGGQRQRLLIARALARHPRVVIFDEATSALDNETQAHVSDSLDRLNATRIVIAHRLSTILHADRIYVLEAGRVVQTGTFQDLIRQHGPFQRLAKRQMI